MSGRDRPGRYLDGAAGPWVPAMLDPAARALAAHAARLRAAAANGFGLRLYRQIPELLEEQLRNLRATAFVLSFFGTLGVLLLMADFGEQTGQVGHALAGSVVGVYATWFVVALGGGRRKWFLGVSLALLVAQGGLWGALVYRVAQTASGDQSNFVVAIAMALVSTPMLGAPFSVAFAFWLPVAAGTALAVGLALNHPDPYLSVAFVCYEAFTLVGVVFINRLLLDNAKSRFMLKARNATVSLLLREYEENAADWLWETDAKGVLREHSPRFAQVLGQPSSAVEGMPLLNMVLAQGGNDAPAARALADAVAAKQGFRDLVLRAPVAGEERWWSLSGHPVLDARGQFLGYRGVGSDVTSAKRAEDTTRYLAMHDALTGAGNRRMFHERMADTFALPGAGRTVRCSALIVMDLDRFKELNDNYGHEVGDLVLQTITTRIKQELRPQDTLARLGGDEFAVIMPDIGEAEAGARGRLYIGLASEPIQVGNAWVNVGASVGAAMFPAHAVTAGELARNADFALYKSKELGRGVCCMFDASFGAVFEERLALMAELRSAVSAGELHVQYQPIVAAASASVVCMEALCRWDHPRRGSIEPSVFIPLAEECGLIGRLGEDMLRRSCAAAYSWEPTVSVSVNVSPLQLKEPGFSALVADVLRETGLGADRLELEITESAWLDGDAWTKDELQRLNALGVRIVLDDFGSGYSSLSTLHSFQFHGLKLDAQFIREAESSRKAKAIVSLVANLSSELGMVLTAEGVETEAQLVLARSFGVTRFQGYLLGRPRTLEPGAGAAPGSSTHPLSELACPQ